jgi:amidase
MGKQPGPESSVDASKSNMAEVASPATKPHIGSTQGKHSPPSSEWAYCSVEKLSRALVTRRISASELLEYFITRIDALDPPLNAVVVRDFERAREAAKRADAAIGRGERWPLLGIPMTFKEAFNIAGLPTTWGFPQFKKFVPNEDAVVVSRIKNAGAIILGKTNVPKGLADFQSYNEIYGTTNNPWNIDRSPGGSSGGSAAAVAAGFGPLSVGSDIGGSTRVPAHFCGVYAHKPTLGVVPMRGYCPPGSPPVPGYGDLAVIGPLARSAGDLAMALDVMAGPDEQCEAIGYSLSLPPARHSNLKDFRVFVVDAHPLMPTDNTVRGAICKLSERLARTGAKVGRASALLPYLSESARIYRRLLASAKSSSITLHQYEEAQRCVAVLPPCDHSLKAEHMRGTVMSHRDWLEVDATRALLRRQWRSFFSEWDILLYPPASVPAFPHDHSLPIESRRIDVDGRNYPFYDACFTWADPASTCGLPATVAPIGPSPAGLPIGIQIIGPYLGDRTTIAFAELLERTFGGFIPPPGYVE